MAQYFVLWPYIKIKYSCRHGSFSETRSTTNSPEWDYNEHIDEANIENLFTDDMPDIQLLFEDDVRQLQDEIQLLRSSNNNETESSRRGQMDVECQPQSFLTCFSCAKKYKFKSGHDIKKGQHLVYGRYMRKWET